MMPNHRRQAVVLVLVMGVVAFIAQVAGVGATRSTHRAAKPKAIALAVLPGGSVPDIGSTSLAKTSVTAAKDETVRMTATASVAATKVGKERVVQVVCGIRYWRAKDRSWSLGTPYETIVLRGRGAKDSVKIERSFQAPAADTYRMATACHVSSPARGAKVTASGTMRAALGLPAGAATPID